MADELAALGRRLHNNRIVTQHGVFDYLARDMGLGEGEHIPAALAVQMGLFTGIQRLSINQILEQLQVELPA